LKHKPQWVKDHESIKAMEEEPLIWVGERGADGVIDGLLPNGKPYLWYKRRGTKDTKFKGRKV
jgi:hypothetical protein